MFSIFLTLASIPIATLVVVSTFWAWYTWKNWKMLVAARSLPTMLPALPLLGHLPYLSFQGKDISSLFFNLHAQSKAIGKRTVCAWIGPFPIVVVQKSEDIRVVLNSTKTIEKGSEYKLFQFAVGDGLFTAPADTWRITRRHLNKMFRPENLEFLIPVYNDTSQQLVHRLSPFVGQGSVNIGDLLYELTLRNLLCLLFGTEIQNRVSSEELKELSKTISTMITVPTQRIFKVGLRWFFLFRLLYKKEVNIIQRLIANLPKEISKIITESFKTDEKEQPVTQNRRNEDSCTFLNEQGDKQSKQLSLPDVYKYLQQTYTQFTIEDLDNEIKTFLATGSETVHTTISSCLIALANHPDIQERVYNEILNVMGNNTSSVTMDHISKLPYLDQVVKETLRRFPLVPVVLRRTEDEIKLSDCTLPKGTTIGVKIRAIHIDPVLYPNPKKFDPDRFLPDNVAMRERYSYLPFSGGPRNCIGKQYSTILIKTVLVHIIREYKVHTKMDYNKMKFKFSIVVSSKEGYTLELEKRKLNNNIK